MLFNAKNNPKIACFWKFGKISKVDNFGRKLNFINILQTFFFNSDFL